jgi:hypothetical protein
LPRFEGIAVSSSDATAEIQRARRTAAIHVLIHESPDGGWGIDGEALSVDNPASIDAGSTPLAAILQRTSLPGH